MDMMELKDSLIEYGVDFQGVMERFVDDERLYFDCLMAFANDTSFDGLQASLDMEDYASAFEHAHVLKGVTGNLGITPLYAAIDNLVEALRSHEYSNLAQQYEVVSEERRRLLQIIK